MANRKRKIRRLVSADVNLSRCRTRLFAKKRVDEVTRGLLAAFKRKYGREPRNPEFSNTAVREGGRVYVLVLEEK